MLARNWTLANRRGNNVGWSVMAPESFKVLLIESDASFARYVQEMLGQSRDLSAEVCWSSELFAALEIARRSPFDVVLLDLNIPDGAGLGNISLLRAVAPGSPISPSSLRRRRR